MTIAAQCLNAAEKNKFDTLRQRLVNDPQKQQELIDMDKTLAAIIQAAISGAGQAESENIRTRIALALRRTFPIG
jgi:hypothetical protein